MICLINAGFVILNGVKNQYLYIHLHTCTFEICTFITTFVYICISSILPFYLHYSH
jgi:hypothetical protein